jgi:hypothetical protein
MIEEDRDVRHRPESETPAQEPYLLLVEAKIEAETI